MTVDHPVPFNRAQFRGQELTYLAQAVLNGHVSGNGPLTSEAETQLRLLVGGGPTLLTTSCTHALEMAALLSTRRISSSISPDSPEVIVPSFTFVSTAVAFLLHGFRPVFVDVRNDTLNMNLELCEAAINSRTRAICLVHYAGVPAEPEAFRKLSDEHGLVLIEDNAHGLGGVYRGRPLGSFGDMSTTSFHETKNITCGEGGALTLNDYKLVQRAEILRDKGTDRSRFYRGQVDKYTWVDLGSSWVLSDLLAGVLLAQLERFDQIQRARRSCWDEYFFRLERWSAERPVRLPEIPEGCENHTAHAFHLRFHDPTARSRFIKHMSTRGISCVFHYQPLHLSPVGKELGGIQGQCPISESAGDCLVRLPLSAGLTLTELERVMEAVEGFDP